MTPFLLGAYLRVDRFTLLSWAIPKERILPWLPAPLRLETIDIPGEGERALLSLFVGRLRLKALGLSLLPISHLAYRTYVRYQSKFGTYSLRGIMDSAPIVATVRGAVGFPVQKGKLKVRWEPSGRAQVLGDEIRLSISSEHAPFQTPGFTHLQQVTEGLLSPQNSYWLHRDGRIKMVRVAHPSGTPLSGTLEEAHLPWLYESKLLTEEEVKQPHSLFFVSRAAMEPISVKEERRVQLPLAIPT